MGKRNSLNKIHPLPFKIKIPKATPSQRKSTVNQSIFPNKKQLKTRNQTLHPEGKNKKE